MTTARPMMKLDSKELYLLFVQDPKKRGFEICNVYSHIIITKANHGNFSEQDDKMRKKLMGIMERAGDRDEQRSRDRERRLALRAQQASEEEESEKEQVFQ